MIDRLVVGAALVALTGCDQAVPSAPITGKPGDKLERAAISAGIVSDPLTLNPVGAYVSATDHICVTAFDGGYRVGASVDYGGGQGCVARGTMRGRETLHLDFADGCTVDARFDGERITFASVPEACQRRCTGRATLGGLSAPRLSSAASEARTMRATDDALLCS